jgi:predicted metal-binding membrane protein
VSEESQQIAARIVQKLRDAGFCCEIFDLGRTKPGVLRRDRIIVGLALFLLTALAWSYLLWLSADMKMDGMDMDGYRMIPSGMRLMMPADAPWRAMEFVFVFAMWTVMMVGMMTPWAAPMILMYARVGRQTEAQAPLIATVWFGIGYFFAWIAFSLFATLVQWAFERVGLLDSKMASTSIVIGGLQFVAAGTYQWTQLKDICLARTQDPFAFLISHGGFRRDAPGSAMLGLRHGAYCVGCCWALMALLFVGGVMNVLWIILLTISILLENVLPFGRKFAAVAGIVLVAAGGWLLSTGMF